MQSRLQSSPPAANTASYQPARRAFAGSAVARWGSAARLAAVLLGTLFAFTQPQITRADSNPEFCATVQQGTLVDPLQGLVAACSDPAGDCYPHDILSPRVRLYLWIIRGMPSGGGGIVAGLSPTEVDAAVDQIQTDYAATGISFLVAGQSFLDDQVLFDRGSGMDDPTSLRTYILANYAWMFHGDAIDVLLLPNDSTKRVIGGSGDGYTIPGTWLLVGGRDFHTTNVVSHEIGHCLG